MLRTLYGRLAVALVLLFVLTGVGYALLSGSLVQRYLQELTQHFNRDLAQRLLDDGNLVVDGKLDQKALKSTFSAYMEINPSIEIYLLDNAGNILSYSADPGRVKRQRVDLGPIRAFLNGEGFPLLGDDPRSHDRRKAFSVAPVPLPGAPHGYLYVVLRGEQYDSAEQAVQESYVLRLSLWAVAGSLGFGLLAGLLLFHLLTRPLRRLSLAMDDFQRSDFRAPVRFAPPDGAGSDEIARLGRSFDEMAARIAQQLDELKRQDRLRRQLIAQASHDLRTPLAALHGYLETLQMRGDKADPADRQEYLQIALRQSERLKRMVEELFELAHLEARETRPVCEPFPLPELLQDVAQKFRLQAQQAAIELAIEPPPAAPFALADLAQTERALDNLIGNALDHTPPGGRVSVELQQAGETLQIVVSDTGPGIPEQELQQIFEPFFRSQNASVPGHAGLGLAIARRIAELQGGRLEATNGPAGGARFILTLPAVINP